MKHIPLQGRIGLGNLGLVPRNDLKSRPGEHDPRTQGGPPPSAIMGMVKPLQKPPFFTWQGWKLRNPYSLTI